MKRFLNHLFRGLAILVMLFIGIALIACTWQLSSTLSGNRLALLCGIGFLAGLCVFPYFRLVPVYVCGHELTHWLTAKLFMRETGKFTLKMARGQVQVKNPNVWIILSPYILPFHLFVLMGLYGLLLFIIDPMPALAVRVFAGCLGAAYAYHLVLTFIAIKTGQQDLRFKGPVFSMCIIITGNICFLFLVLMFATRQWQTAGRLVVNQCLTQAGWITNAVQYVYHSFT